MSTSSSAAPLDGVRTVLERLTPTSGRPVLLYALYTGALFLVFLLATFPWELAIRRGLQDALGRSMTAEVTGARLGWSLATTIDDLRLLPVGAGTTPVVRAQALQVRPSLFGLLWASPFPVRTRADLYGGTIEGTLDPRASSFDVDARASGIDLGRWGGLAHFSGGTIRGRLNLALALTGDWTAPTTLNGRIALTGLGLGLEGVDVRGVTLPDLHFAQLQVGGTITNGRVDIAELTGSGTEVDLVGSGHLLLRDPPQQSLLNLEVTLTPTQAAPKGLTVAVGLIPGEAGPNGSRLVRIAGPLGAPKLR